MVLLLYTIIPCVAAPCSSDYWYFHPYIIQHFNEMFLHLLYIHRKFKFGGLTLHAHLTPFPHI